jgi:hypothetical protein
LIETVNSQKAKLVFLKMDNNVPSTWQMKFQKKFSFIYV